MKEYELAFDYQIKTTMPIVCRIDGRKFSKLTKKLDKPFDEDFMNAMRNTARAIMKEMDASIAETHSDEISLVFNVFGHNTQMPFNYRIQKLASITAAATSVIFYKNLLSFPTLIGRLSKKNITPVFDCRYFKLPHDEVINYLRWRRSDAYRNSVNGLGQKYFSHNFLHGLNPNQIKDRLKEIHNVNWEDLEPHKKFGTVLTKYISHEKLDKSELDDLPEKHHARNNPDLVFKRTRITISTLEDLPEI